MTLVKDIRITRTAVYFTDNVYLPSNNIEYKREEERQKHHQFTTGLKMVGLRLRRFKGNKKLNDINLSGSGLISFTTT